MKKFLKTFLLFVSPILILAYPLDLLVSHGLRNSTYSDGEMETWTDIYSGNINSDYWIYGSSRAWVHIDPIRMEAVTGNTFYNMGMDAHNFYMQYFRHTQLMKHNEKPKAIILGLDMFTLEKRADLYNLEQFVPDMLWNRDIEKATESYIGFQKEEFYIPFVRYIGRFDAIKSGIKYYKTPDERFRTKGYKARIEEWNEDFDEARTKIGLYKPAIDSTTVQLFEDFLKECRDKEIDLIFVYTPEHMQGQTFVEGREQIMQLYSDWAKEYNIPFLDYSLDPICYDKRYFYNSMHMNKLGSEKFTTEFANDLVSRKLIEMKNDR